jgi:hypothetical protein
METESFASSEKHRKYLIAITFNGEKYFTVWGTDMKDNEVDKLLVNSGKLIVFRKKSAIKIAAARVKNVFKDEQTLLIGYIQSHLKRLIAA